MAMIPQTYDCSGPFVLKERDSCKMNASNFISLCLLLPKIARSNTGLWKYDFSQKMIPH